MSQPHENVVGVDNDGDPLLTIKTFDGWVGIYVSKHENDLRNAVDNITATTEEQCFVEKFVIDSYDGYLIIVPLALQRHDYVVIYSPDSQVSIGVDSGMDFFDTSDFLRNLHIEKEG